MGHTQKSIPLRKGPQLVDKINIHLDIVVPSTFAGKQIPMLPQPDCQGRIFLDLPICLRLKKLKGTSDSGCCLTQNETKRTVAYV